MNKFPHADDIRLGMQRPRVSDSFFRGCFYGFLIEAFLFATVLAVIWLVHKFNW